MATENPLTEAQQQILRSQVFDELHPGPILHDFQAVLDFVGTTGVKASGKHNLLPLDAIPKLDEKLAHPLRLPLKRPQLRSHPHLQGLHLLLRASGLTRVEGTGDKARLDVDPAVLDVWKTLNPTEQYFALLEAWLLCANAEMVGERDRTLGEGFLSSCITAHHSLQRKKRHPGIRAGELYLPGIGRQSFCVALMDLFGLIEVQHPRTPAVPWCPLRLTPTAFGTALFALLDDAEDYPEDSEEEETEDEEPPDESPSDTEGGLQPLLAPWFPAWHNNLVLPQPEQREGIFVFRVSQDEMWRLLAISSEDTLDDLAAAILDSVKFDFDHLYDFTYRDRFGATVEASHPEAAEDLSADEVLIGELPLQIGQSMTFQYDYGQDWEFDVKLERIDPPNPRTKKPRVLEKHGTAPRQYPGADW